MEQVKSSRLPPVMSSRGIGLLRRKVQASYGFVSIRWNIAYGIATVNRGGVLSIGWSIAYAFL